MLQTIIDAAIRAGQAIMSIYTHPDTDWEVERKADNSPLTLADRKSHAVIAEALKHTPYPVLSEEGEHLPYEVRQQWETLWVVDPLDGTKEFLKRNDEFTVNIALVTKGEGQTMIMHDMRRERFRDGDTLVLLADDSFMQNWGDSSFFLMVSNGKEQEAKMPQWKRVTSVILLLLMIVGATVGELPAVRAAFPDMKLDMFFFVSIVTIIMAWLNLFPARKYTKFISWDILITIASAFAISRAMQNSGMADAVAQFAVGLSHDYSPLVLLAVIFIITNVFTELMTNNAAAALAFPVSLSIAEHMQVSPMPFFVTICMAASASFSSPIGYQTNLIVQGIGNYRFGDFVRIGLPLNLISLIITLIFVPMFWPF